MSQEPQDLKKSVLIIRRHKVLIGIVAGVGLLIGAGYAEVKPPEFTSTAIVSLPSSGVSIATQAVIADSIPVLSGALARISPPVSVDNLRSEVQVKTLATSLISITATGKTAAAAEATANAVADSYSAYVGNKKSPVGHIVARMFQPATTATGSSKLKTLIIIGLIGALAGAVLGAVASIAIGRKDRRLRMRDQIANSIGVPVIASVPVGHPSDAAGWAKLLAQYRPPAVDAWQLRTAMHQLGITDHSMGQPPYNIEGLVSGGDGGGVSLAVVSLSSDPGALALGPQLAAFAASQGIPTALVIGPEHGTNATATLRAACAAAPSASSELPRFLRLFVTEDGVVHGHERAALSVVVVVVDGSAPKVPEKIHTAATVIGVSAGKATAEQLARAAMVAAADGREILGILVADPDQADQTTGRVPRLTRPARRKVPNRLRGEVAEIRR
jgi:capsular polysaccharide biosynthesis protein